MFQTKAFCFLTVPLFSHVAMADTHVPNSTDFKTYTVLMKAEEPCPNTSY